MTSSQLIGLRAVCSLAHHNGRLNAREALMGRICAEWCCRAVAQPWERVDRSESLPGPESIHFFAERPCYASASVDFFENAIKLGEMIEEFATLLADCDCAPRDITECCVEYAGGMLRLSGGFDRSLRC